MLEDGTWPSPDCCHSQLSLKELKLWNWILDDFKLRKFCNLEKFKKHQPSVVWEVDSSHLAPLLPFHSTVGDLRKYMKN